MANTYTLISSNTLTSSAASVTFSAIPNTYTDLVLRYSTRTDFANIVSSAVVYFNGNQSTTSYSLTSIFGDGSTASSTRNSSRSDTFTLANGTNTTSNTFSSNEIYIPNYLANANKPYSNFDAVENNATSATVRTQANLFSSTSAITSITITYGSGNFVSGSSFYLYGIKNS